jgi:hypothetical protein
MNFWKNIPRARKPCFWRLLPLGVGFGGFKSACGGDDMEGEKN